MDRPTRWLYLIAALLALTLSIDWLFRTPVGVSIWCAGMIAFSWPIVRFRRPWLSGATGAAGAGVAAYALRLMPTVGSDKARFIAEIVAFAVMAVLGYLVVVRGYWNPYNKARQ